MGRHINLDAVVDEHPDATRERLLSGVPLLSGPLAEPRSHPLEAQAVISPDTHVGIDFEVAAGTPDAAASPEHPDALIQGGLVGDGHELE